MRIADLLAMRRAQKRMHKLVRKLGGSWGDRNGLAELWLRCHQYCGHSATVLRFDTPDEDWNTFRTAHRYMEEIEKHMELSEIVDRIEHLIDPIEARSLRAKATDSA